MTQVEESARDGAHCEAQSIGLGIQGRMENICRTKEMVEAAHCPLFVVVIPEGLGRGMIKNSIHPQS